jgi:quinohemoprotein ethanol dehydrogenase
MGEPMKNSVEKLFTIAMLLIVVSCHSVPEPGTIQHLTFVTEQVDNNRLLSADETPEDWLSYGRNYQEDRFSPLSQITKSNIDSLGLVWSINLGTTRGIETTPIVVDGIMYITGPWSMVYAIDARKGQIIWIYDPEVPREYGEKGCCGVVNRGVALYKGMIFLGAFDGRLIAINAVTGTKVWEVMTIDQKRGYTITGAPRVVDGKVIIGNGGAEYGVRGYVTAYDAMNGDQLWRFYTVPGNPADGFESKAMESAAETWTGEWWKYGGGGTAWDAMAYDPDLNLLYIGTGNGSPWDRDLRSPGGGDNLYLSSIVALNPDNGELKWYYQTTPGDSWDYTATQPIILADLEIDGAVRKTLMQAPKNGFFYVIDRTNGHFISAEPFVYTNWAKEIDYQTGRPIETSFSRYKDINAQIAPHPFGGHNWHPMAYNKLAGLVYIPARESSHMYGKKKNWEFTDDGKSWNTGAAYNTDNPDNRDSLANQWHGRLIAWDPIKQKEVWSLRQNSLWNGGILATEELVFQGTGEGDFKIYDAETGHQLWTFSLQTGIVAPPISYVVDGIQYVTLVAGWGGGMAIYAKYTDQINPGGIYTFAIGGRESPPEYPDKEPREIVDLEFAASEENINHGKILFNRYCRTCHGGDGVIPNLVYSRPEIISVFHQIVGEGAFLVKGMPGFHDRLSDEDIIDIKNYILSDAKTRRAKQTNGNIK